MDNLHEQHLLNVIVELRAALERAATNRPSPSGAAFDLLRYDYEQRIAALEATNDTLSNRLIAQSKTLSAVEIERDQAREFLAAAQAIIADLANNVYRANAENAILRARLAELPAIVEQLVACDYECVAGPLDGNVMFVRLSEIAGDLQAGTPPGPAAAQAWQWTPVAGGIYPIGTGEIEISEAGATLGIFGADEVGDDAYAILALTDDYRFCRRTQPVGVAQP